MADSLASRVTRILAGSAHAFLDVVEDMAPEAMMRQAGTPSVAAITRSFVVDNAR